MSAQERLIEVTCAIIVENQKILCTRRNQPHPRAGLWEFPGGKKEPGESNEECIRREIKEELGLKIELLRELLPVEHHYPDISIRLIPFLARPLGKIEFLTDHDSAHFFSFEEAQKIPLADADLKVLHQLLALNL